MPQMSPMMWLFIYIYSLMLILLMLCMLYYLYMYFNIKFIKNLLMKKKFNFLW